MGSLSLVDAKLTLDNSELLVPSTDPLPLDTSNNLELSLPQSNLNSDEAKNLALMHINSFESKALDLGRKAFRIENPREMITRWEIANLDLKTVVEDVLVSGHLPLAVLQLHLHQIKDVVADKESNDTFAEVRDIGRAIAYDLFLKVAYS